MIFLFLFFDPDRDRRDLDLDLDLDFLLLLRDLVRDFPLLERRRRREAGLLDAVALDGDRDALLARASNLSLFLLARGAMLKRLLI